MLRYAVIRLLYGVIAFLAVTIILYSFFRANPPLHYFRGEGGTEAALEWEKKQIESLRAFAKFDGRWFAYYPTHFGNVFQGYSYEWQGHTVADMIVWRLPRSLALGGVAGGIGILLTLGLGVMSAAKPHSPLDNAGKALATIARATPHFVVAILLLWTFAAILEREPPRWWEGFPAWVLPVTVLSLSTIGILPFLRSAMLNQMASEHVKMARLRGLPEWKIALKHALRIVVMASPAHLIAGFSSFVGSLIVVEFIFEWPGLGLLTYEAANARDYLVLHGIALFTATALIALHVAVDIALAFADPRIRFPEAREYALTPAVP